ncbi:MAG: hypothetical protein JJE40_10530 [Vicinamibacteria bacterium]|nr:hypothetical protein [Vicinamibacteria bacterium]
MASAACLLGGDYEGLNPDDPREQAWLWNGQRWMAPVTHEAPPAVSLVAAVGDPERKSVLIYGGFAVLGPRRYGPPSGDVWEWDRTRWHRVETTTGPGERAHHAMAYDSKRHRIVVRGGTRPDKVHPTDTWEWDGQVWHRAASDGAGPGGGFAWPMTRLER